MITCDDKMATSGEAKKITSTTIRKIEVPSLQYPTIAAASLAIRSGDPNVFFAVQIVGNTIDGIYDYDDGEDDGNNFNGCTRLVSIVIPSSVKEIRDAFEGCSELREIMFIPGEGMETIECSTFGGCTNLSTVQLPTSLREIGPAAFTECTKLQSIHIPEGVICIHRNAFRRCNALADVSIPQSLKYIGSGAFVGCALVSVVVPASTKIEICDEFPGKVCDIVFRL